MVNDTREPRYGYTIKVFDDGEVDFAVIGEVDFVQLLGLHAWVGIHIQEPYTKDLIQQNNEKIMGHIMKLYAISNRLVAKAVSEEAAVQNGTSIDIPVGEIPGLAGEGGSLQQSAPPSDTQAQPCSTDVPTCGAPE